MRHWKCFIRMIECLDDEVPLFTRGALWLCIIAPYASVGFTFGSVAACSLVSVTCFALLLLAFVGEALESRWLYSAVRQFERLPSAIKKCVKCVEDAE